MIRIVLLCSIAIALIAAQTPPPNGGVASGSSSAAASGSGSAASSGASTTTTGTTCCTTKACSQIYQKIDNSTRTVYFTGCPGYDWTSQSTPNTAYFICNSLTMNVNPIMRSTPQYVGTSNPILGALGVAINGVALYGPTDAEGRDAMVYEGSSMDTCGGHPQQQGNYHYHKPPKEGCAYNETANAHGHLVGLMVDGIPIYSKYEGNGATPTDLDACGGHVGVVTAGVAAFYHYHGSDSYPYMVNCLMGCIQTTIHGLSTDCTAAATQYNYDSVKNAFATVPSAYTCISTATPTTSALASSGAESLGVGAVSMMWMGVVCAIAVMLQ